MSSKWYEHIELEPYSGEAEGSITALVESLGMNIHFDDVNTETCRFCFRENWDSPIVNYDISFEELNEWYAGRIPLIFDALEHDESRFSDLVFFEK